MPPKTWVPLESNPAVLTEYAAQLGLDTSKHSFSDVFGLDDELLAMVPQPVLAVIMCYPLTDQSEAAAKDEDKAQAAHPAAGADLYYLKQTVGNACGTIAVLHGIGNNRAGLHIAGGSFLSEFLAATQGKTAAEIGRYLEDPPEGAPNIEAAHQAAAAGGDTAPPPEDEDVNLHFVAFVAKDGQLWQLDGRRAGPVCHGPTTPATLLHDTAKVVKQFIERSNSLSFNLIALTATPDE